MAQEAPRWDGGCHPRSIGWWSTGSKPLGGALTRSGQQLRGLTLVILEYKGSCTRLIQGRRHIASDCATLVSIKRLRWSTEANESIDDADAG